jgi:signal transduction histidine kinase
MGSLSFFQSFEVLYNRAGKLCKCLDMAAHYSAILADNNLSRHRSSTGIAMYYGPSGLTIESPQKAKGNRRSRSSKGVTALWVISLGFWLGLFFYWPWPARLSLAYGSFLIWAIAAVWLWGKKAPFMTLGIFMCTGWILHRSNTSVEENFAWMSPSYPVWLGLVFLSSLCTWLWQDSRRTVPQEQKRQPELEEVLLHMARMSSLGRMTNSICHEMKNLIAVIVGYLEQLQDEQELSDRNRRKIDRSLLASERMIAIVAQLRHAARPIDQDPVQSMELNPLIQDSRQFLNHHLLYNSIEMDLNLAEDLPAISNVSSQVQAIFLQLLNHSIDSFKSNKNNDELAKRISLTTARDGSSLLVHYRDNAIRSFSLAPSEAFDLAHHLRIQQGLNGFALLLLQQGMQRLDGNVRIQQDAQTGLQVEMVFRSQSMPPIEAGTELNTQLRVS